MDELEISGKRYISSKRAAKDNRYHVDYIGQLIRAGKIAGSKVGRTWYVEAESLAHYLDQEYTPPTTRAPDLEIYVPVVKPKVISEKMKEEKEEEEAVKPVTSWHPAPTPLQHITITKLHDEAEDETEVAIQKSMPASAPRSVHTGMSGLRYIADDEPLLPPVARRERTVEIQRPEPQQVMPVRSQTLPRTAAGTRYATASPVARKTLLVGAGVVGLLAFCGALSLSYFLKADTTVEAANTYSSIHF